MKYKVNAVGYAAAGEIEAESPKQAAEARVAKNFLSAELDEGCIVKVTPEGGKPIRCAVDVEVEVHCTATRE